MDFDEAFAHLISNEGALSMDPNDRGNWTGGKVGVGQLKGSKYGISAASYPHLDIANLTLAQAKTIYKADYWNVAGCDAVPDGLKFSLFDFAVNSGPKTAAKRLQQAVGAEPDGAIGPKTLIAIGNYHIAEVKSRFQAQRMLLMVGDTAAWPAQGRGWMIRLANNALKGL